MHGLFNTASGLAEGLLPAWLRPDVGLVNAVLADATVQVVISRASN